MVNVNIKSDTKKMVDHASICIVDQFQKLLEHVMIRPNDVSNVCSVSYANPEVVHEVVQEVIQKLSCMATTEIHT